MLALGFLAGLWTYAHVYACFRSRMEEEAKRKMASLEIADRQREARLRLLADQVKRAYGTLGPEHQAVVGEEIEAILGAGPGDGRGL